VKDVEDIEGDERNQCKTFPLLFGIARTKQLSLLLLLLNFTIIVYYLFIFFNKNTLVDFYFLSAMFLIPYASLSYLILTAEEKKDFYYAGVFLKILMLAGVLTVLPFNYYFL
jgi:4-hydroxybenzoate polyprenyltransferase